MTPSPSPNPIAKEDSGDGGTTAQPMTSTSSSSSTSCWWLLAAIPLVLVALIGGLGMMTNATSTTTTTTTTPGLDFGTGNMFDKIATRYDTINRVLAMNMDIGWRRKMTQRIQELLSEKMADKDNNNNNAAAAAAAPWKILDMATGTADVALQLVDDLQPTHPTTVLGLDPSENMLSVGRSKIAERKNKNKTTNTDIVLETADARDLTKYYEQTRLFSQKFDAATMAFGIRNVVPNREKALCEIHKLLKPNGVLAILEFSEPTYAEHGILGAAAGVFIQNVVPFVGGLLSGGAKQEYKHLQNSIRGFPSPKDFREQLQDLECPLRDDDEDVYFYVGNYDMEEVVHMNFGSVQLYIGRAAVEQKVALKSNNSNNDPRLPPIGAAL